eukprot:CAMPEP_0118722074 /NCGR_PEP_ID=MMETSP0800-20121206/31135_1 /TAXON_ID=210618 ORGANISM="Striatella unipunctata, Strain CCMP2910" /NCGR_SAMPLE_ID=MMETSP0800 /ASSEMBLY_ACC=CAM_ASM_000638 /LENGTH=574 /DNA_ID=CAMNT_0006630127 /DNA_START=197 /DNA_END=1921 /DNA_ORIENTATION=-
MIRQRSSIVQVNLSGSPHGSSSSNINLDGSFSTEAFMSAAAAAAAIVAAEDAAPSRRASYHHREYRSVSATRLEATRLEDSDDESIQIDPRLMSSLSSMDEIGGAMRTDGEDDDSETVKKNPPSPISSRFRPFLSALSILTIIFLLFLAAPHRNRSKPSGSHKPTTKITMETTSIPLEGHVDSLNTFGWHVFSKLSKEDKNIVISPISILTALGMVELGTTMDSKAQEELLLYGFSEPQLQGLLSSVHSLLKNQQEDKVQVEMANSIWTKPKLVEKAYKQHFASSPMWKDHTDVLDVPDHVALINQWVYQKTAGRIPTILDRIPDNLVALLVNAIYFKGDWTTAFDPDETEKEATFYVGASKEKKVEMMHLENEKFKNLEMMLTTDSSDRVMLVDVPYGNSKEWVATIVLPVGTLTLDKVMKAFESDIEKNDKSTIWTTWMDGLAMMDEEKLDILSIPRFSLKYGSSSMRKALQSMGIKTVFDVDASNPPLSRLSSDPEAYLDDVLHQATLECTESGTVASAATVAVIMTRSMPMPNPRIVCNRPFLMVVRHVDTNLMLFAARIDDPSLAAVKP